MRSRNVLAGSEKDASLQLSRSSTGGAVASNFSSLGNGSVQRIKCMPTDVPWCHLLYILGGFWLCK